jgi:hypothetical protein
LIALAVSLSVSLRAAVWISLPVLLVLNGFVLLRVQASRRTWVIVGCADRLYVRLFAWRNGEHGEVYDRDVLVLEAPDIASMSIRTVEVFLHGPEPKFVEWLVIEPAQTVAEDVSRHIRPLLTLTDPGKAVSVEEDVPSHIRPLLTLVEPDKVVLVANEGGRLTIEWRWWRPALRVFLQQVLRECPSVVIATEERSELDLNGIWQRRRERNREYPDAQQRRLLVQARRLGFGCKCALLLGRYKQISFQRAAAYLAEYEQEEAGTSQFTVQQ